MQNMKTIFAAACIFLAGTAWSAPFGIHPGTSLKTIEKAAPSIVKGETNGTYISKTVPKPVFFGTPKSDKITYVDLQTRAISGTLRFSKTFDEYKLLVAPKTGLCEIEGIGFRPSANDYRELRERLISVYGIGDEHSETYITGETSFTYRIMTPMTDAYSKRTDISSITLSGYPFQVKNLDDNGKTVITKGFNLHLKYSYSNLAACHSELATKKSEGF